MTSIPNYLPIETAAHNLQITSAALRQLIDIGKIPAIIMNGEIAVSEETILSDLPKEERPEYKLHAELKGIPISMSDASRKYGVHKSNISNWVAKGYISILNKIGNKVLIDEADLSYCVEIYKEKHGQGKWIFNPDGTPYQVTTIRKR